MTTRLSSIIRALAAVLLTTALLAACGGGDGGDSGSKSDGDCKVVEPTSEGQTEIEVVARDMDYVDTCYQVEPGQVTVNFTSDDGDVAHNFHLTGNGVNEATKVLTGGKSETLELDLSTPGTYDFVCDPHPNMTGEVRVVKPSSLPGS